MRKIEFAIGEYYHILNRGVDKRIVFNDEMDYRRFLLSMNLLNDEKDGLMAAWKDFRKYRPRARLWDFPKLKVKSKPLVEFVAYCLNPNHYHLIVRQLREKGIEKFMHKLGTSYTHYFNNRNERTGSLFQGKFKAVHINSNSYLLYLSAYVNNNHFIHGYKNREWKYSSLPDYFGIRDSKICNKDVILSQFDYRFDEYKDFVMENSLYMKEKKELEKLLLED